MKLGTWSVHLTIGLILWAVISFAMAPAVQHLMSVVLYSVSYDYTLFAPVLTLVLVIYRYHQLREKARPVPPRMDGRALWALVFFVLVYLFSELSFIAILGHGAYIGALLSAVWLVMGARHVRFYGFALFSLFFIIPFGEVIIPQLQVLSAGGAVGLISLLGFPASSDGVFMVLSGGTYEIVRACAGLHFLTTSLMIGYFLSNLIFERLRDRIILMTIAAVLPVFVNMLRVMTIVLIAELYSFDFAVSTDHMIYGWVFLSVISILLIAIAYKLAPKKLTIRPPLQYPAASSFMPVWGAAAVCLLTFFTSHQIQNAAINQQLTPHLVYQGESWRALEYAPPEWRPQYQGYDAVIHQAYRQNGIRLDAQLYFYQYQREGHELLSLSNKVGDARFRHLPDNDQVIEVGGLTVLERRLSSGAQKPANNSGYDKLVWQIYYNGDQPVASAAQLWAQIVKKRLSGQNPAAATLIIGVDLTPAYNGGDQVKDQSRLQARQQLRDFLQSAAYSLRVKS